ERARLSTRLRSHSLPARHTSPVRKVSPTRAISNQRMRVPPLVVHLEHGEEGLLRDFHPTDLLHPLLAFLLLLQQLLLARPVATVALGEDVLAQRLDRGAGD